MNYHRWIAHFESNRLDRPEPDWHAPFSMPGKKRRLLARSLSEYQLGDGGGECRLVAADADAYRATAADVRRVVDLWFAEELEHSRLLTGAVQRIGGKFVTTTPAFELFYVIRRRLGVQVEMLVLLVVEIVSTGYYRVVRESAHAQNDAGVSGASVRSVSPSDVEVRLLRITKRSLRSSRAKFATTRATSFL